MTDKQIPAIYRQDAIKAEKAESKNQKIDLDNKNIPAVIRKSVVEHALKEYDKLKEQKSVLSGNLATEIKKRDEFVQNQNKIIDDLYTELDVLECKISYFESQFKKFQIVSSDNVNKK